jgi:hypothetical protein
MTATERRKVGELLVQLVNAQRKQQEAAVATWTRLHDPVACSEAQDRRGEAAATIGGLFYDLAVLLDPDASEHLLPRLLADDANAVSKDVIAAIESSIHAVAQPDEECWRCGRPINTDVDDYRWCACQGLFTCAGAGCQDACDAQGCHPRCECAEQARLNEGVRA